MSTRLMSHGPCLKRGLTFVELLLAMSLFTVVLAAAGSLLLLGLRAQRLSPESAPLAFERAILQLERDLDAAAPLVTVPVVVEPERLEFAAVTRLPDEEGAAATGWSRIRYSIAGGETPSLIREQFALDDDRLLARDTLMPIADAGFSFAMTDGEQLLWQDTAWPAEAGGVAQLPRLLRLQGQLPGSAPVAIDRVLRLPDGALPTVSP